MKISIVENVLKLNDELASLNRQALRDASIFTVDLIGAPGCGKTALLCATIPLLGPQLRCAVIVGDLATQRDADRLAKVCDQVVQINTGKGCHLEAHHIRKALAQIDLADVDILFIENVGNLICPVGFDLGQDVKVGMFAVTEGDDKAAKHPYIVTEADILLLGKIDMLPLAPFNRPLFREDIQKLKPGAKLIELTVVDDTSMQPWLDWLVSQARERSPRGRRKEPRS
jgi:hydrogenase nickel incorporation protein HypB